MLDDTRVTIPVSLELRIPQGSVRPRACWRVPATPSGRNRRLSGDICAERVRTNAQRAVATRRALIVVVENSHVDFAAVAIAVLALLFTIGSFWWLYARKGRIVAGTPRTYAFVDAVRLRLPLALFNTGAIDVIVADLRVTLIDATREPMRWITTRTKLRPETDDGFAFATPFAVPGRATRELIAEFGDDAGWKPQPKSRHRLRLEAQVHPSDEWVAVAEFDWWAPQTADVMGSYITHRNKAAP